MIDDFRKGYIGTKSICFLHREIVKQTDGKK